MATATLRKKGLGQYFTPVPVVDFILDTVKEIGRFQPDYTPRLVDPACGEGVFLVRALEKGIGVPSTIVGIDIDERVQEAWRESGIDRVLNGNLFIQNGLYDTADGTISEQSNDDLFDYVVGNPPYGGAGLSEIEADEKLSNALKTFELWKLGNNQRDQNDQENLFQNDILDDHIELTKNDIERLERFPIELLFLERFIRLAKSGGVIGIIIPDGILANVNYGYVRNWILERCNIVAIVSLPHNVFRETGTTAKTSILFLQKKGAAVKPDEKVFMAQIEEDDINDNGGKAAFDFLLNKFISNFEGYTHNSPRMWKDITHGDLDPKVRWDADYYDPKYRFPIEKMRTNYKTIRFEEVIVESVSGYRGKTEFVPSGIRCIEARCVREYGLDVNEGRFVPESGNFDTPNRRIKQGDILIVRSGVGCAGRVICIEEIPEEMTIGGHIYKIKTDDQLLPTYITVFLKSYLGWLQIDRERAGTGALVLDVDAIKNLNIPELSIRSQLKVDKLYKLANGNHRKAMERKWGITLNSNHSVSEYENDNEFMKLIDKAQKYLQQAISIVEEEIKV